MKLSPLVAMTAFCSLGGTAPAHADDVPSRTVTGNVALTTDYVFRGLTQAWGKLAVQGGGDLSMANGFAAGVWGSSISECSYPGGSMELDLYASYGRPIDSDWSWRMGVYGYLYPGANLDQAGLRSRSPNTVEANAALGWRWLTLKYSRALTDYFAADVEQGYRGDSRGTGYLQLDATLPLGARWSLALRAGHTHYSTHLALPLTSGTSDPDYTDLGVSLKYQYAAHWSVTAGVTHADNAAFYRRTASFSNPSDTLDVGGTRGFVTWQGSF